MSNEMKDVMSALFNLPADPGDAVADAEREHRIMEQLRTERLEREAALLNNAAADEEEEEANQ